MFIDLWVASDGITVLRFSDESSARIYCAETGWPISDLLHVRQQVTVGEDGAITVEPWRNRMDPNVDVPNPGTWQEFTNVYLPPSESMVGGQTIDDEVVPTNYNHLKDLAYVSEMLGWPFRDLAAREPAFFGKLMRYVTDCVKQNKKPVLQEAEKIVGSYAN